MILHPLHTDILPPKEMNNPFDYDPHPLCLLAAEEVQRHIAQQPEEWRREVDMGKMFGVLVCSHLSPLTSRLSYVAAYSGQIAGCGGDDYFVPAVFDYLQPDGYFKTHEAEISEINHAIAVASTNPERTVLRKKLADKQNEAAETIERYAKLMEGAKALRDIKRKNTFLSEADKQALIRESQFQKAQLRRLKRQYGEECMALEQQLAVFNDHISQLEHLRKEKSRALQQWLFENFELLNARGERRNLLQLFADTAFGEPPSGAGECCEPKLLHYAYSHNLRPLCMSMFWWGASPKSEVRHHLHYYPACSGKCKPILKWMMGANNSCFSPLSSHHSPLPILYSDPSIIVISKPAGLLTIPGATTHLSVYSLLNESGALIVHRLDQDTSGLLVVAKTREAHKNLQKQFADHTVVKRYRAILDGLLPEGTPEQGEISLPLRPDLFDRPRQLVDHEHGKSAVTHYTIDKVEGNYTYISLYPKTGRTHQLRMHCAHQEGLATPILGDPLYGRKSDRLYLHADYLEFTHPTTGNRIHFEDKAPWIE